MKKLIQYMQQVETW